MRIVNFAENINESLIILCIKWKNDKMNGKGKYTWRNKRYVTGTWKNGKLNGIATYKNGKYKYTVGVYKGKIVKVYGRKRA